MSAIGWWNKAKVVAMYDDRLGDLLTTQEREQVNAILVKAIEPYSTVKGMLERKLDEGKKRLAIKLSKERNEHG